MRIVRLFFLTTVLPVGTALAQAADATPVTFDLLQQARAADSLRAVVARQRSDIARLNRTVATLSDSIKSSRKAPTIVAPSLVDTLHRADRTDTPRVDSVKARPHVAKPEPVAAPKASAPSALTFAPPQFAGLLQVWAVAGDAGYRSTVRIRRAEVKVVSDLGRRSRATVVFDIAKSLSLSTSGSGQVAVSQNSRALQDGFISLALRPVQIEAGQMKVPLGYEGTLSSSALESAERPLMFSDRARGGTFGDIRDIGLVVRGRTSWLEYQAGAFNGSGENQNDIDRNVAKSAIARLTIAPRLVRGLQLGASGATSGEATTDKPTRDRLGAELVYRLGALLTQVEAMRGQDAAITRNGGYALIAYAIKPNVRVHARADAWDPDTQTESSAATATERDYLAGVTWLPAATRLKLQLVGVRKTFTRNIVPAATQAIITMQASW